MKNEKNYFFKFSKSGNIAAFIYYNVQPLDVSSQKKNIYIVLIIKTKIYLEDNFNNFFSLLVSF